MASAALFRRPASQSEVRRLPTHSSRGRTLPAREANPETATGGFLLPRYSFTPRSRPGMVDARDAYLTGELAGLWRLSHDHICRAASELGRNATLEAVHKKAVELQEAA